MAIAKSAMHTNQFISNRFRIDLTSHKWKTTKIMNKIWTVHEPVTISTDHWRSFHYAYMKSVAVAIVIVVAFAVAVTGAAATA